MYKNIVSGYNTFVKYHDDMNEKGVVPNVQIIPFPFDDLFGDFRLFNGIPLEQMDEFIGRIREIMVEIANVHAENAREEKIENEKKQEAT